MSNPGSTVAVVNTPTVQVNDLIIWKATLDMDMYGLWKSWNLMKFCNFQFPKWKVMKGDEKMIIENSTVLHTSNE